MISVHHLECSRSFRILWALEELGLDYDIHFYQRLPNYSAPALYTTNFTEPLSY
ncbi:hypothetical protein ACXHIA_003978, partial [Acinetobacter baumannii]